MTKQESSGNTAPSPAPEVSQFNDAFSIIRAHDNSPSALFGRQLGALMGTFIKLDDVDKGSSFDEELAITSFKNDLERETDQKKTLESLEWAESVMKRVGLSVKAEIADDFKLVSIDDVEADLASSDHALKAQYSLVLSDGNLLVEFIETALSEHLISESDQKSLRRFLGTIDTQVIVTACRLLSKTAKQAGSDETSIAPELLEFIKYAGDIERAMAPHQNTAETYNGGSLSSLSEYFLSEELTPMLRAIEHGYIAPRSPNVNIGLACSLTDPIIIPETVNDYIPEGVIGSEQDIIQNIQVKFIKPLKELASLGSVKVLGDSIQSVRSMLEILKDPNAQFEYFHNSWESDPTRSSRVSLACNLLEIELEQLEKEIA